ncbi:MAG: hypothetical protein ACE5RJ_01580 [Nitrosopumilaceae archaeon]
MNEKRLDDFIDHLNYEVVEKIKLICFKVDKKPTIFSEMELTLIRMASNGTFTILSNQGLINTKQLKKVIN